MSIGVQSYTELYTMILGWSLYDKLWNLLTQTGIAYIPFVGMILKNIAQSYTQGHDGVNHGLRNMEVNLILTLLLILFGAAPFISLDARTISYTPMCGTDSDHTYHPNETGTTYDKAFALPKEDVRVPIWWYAVISVSEGMTNAANSMVGCVPDLRKMITQVNTTPLSDPILKKEVYDFEAMCYAPARLQYLNDVRTGMTANTVKIKEDMRVYGAEDIGWIGSHAFNNVYYRNLKATTPVTRFQYVPSDDINSDMNAEHPPAFGTPNCYLWWNSESTGLKDRILQSMSKEFYREFNGILSTEKMKEDLIKKLISGAPMENRGYDNATDMMSDVGYSRITSALGILYFQSQEYPKIYAAGQAAPIIQSLLLLMIYVFLPFGLIFSGYKPSAFIAATAMIFSVIFWGFIWHLISWTDHALMSALYSNWFAKQGAGATLTDMIIGSMVIGAPLFWFMFLGALGIAAGNVVNGAFAGMSRIGQSSAEVGASQVKNAASTAVSSIAKGM